MFKPFIIIMTILSSFWLASGTVTQAYAQSEPIYTSSKNNLSAGGFDVVSYHTGTPLKGDPLYFTKWKDTEWRFASQENLDLFLSNKEKYAPAYGGYCAWAVAKNKLAKGNPKHWAIHDGVLYLNYNKRIKKKWLADQDSFIAEANSNWPTIFE